MATDTPFGTMADSGGTAGPRRPEPAGGWTAGRVVALVIGAVLALVSLGLLGGGGTLLWADQTQRHGGFVTTGAAAYSTSGYALATEHARLGWGLLLTGLVGEVRIQIASASPGRPVFIAVGPSDRVAAYLSGTAYATVTGTGTGGLVSHGGIRRPSPPGAAGIWAARAAGTGTQVLRWTARSGTWTVVAMNPDGSPGLAVRASAGVSAPGLLRLAIEALIGGVLAALLSAALIMVPVRLASGAR